MKKITLSILILLSFILTFADCAAYAADFSFTAPSSIPIGTEFKIDILLTPQNEPINAFSGKVIMDNIDEAFIFERISNGSVETQYWIQPPEIKKNNVYFAGILPGGQIQPDILFSIIARAKNQGAVVLSFADVQAHVNDSNASLTAIQTGAATITAGDGDIGQPAPAAIFDLIPPESFEPAISRNEYLFDGKPFMVFITMDNGSGIDHYEIAEAQPLFWNRNEPPENLDWKIEQSPYPIKDKTLSGAVFIKAVDHAGNERISIVTLENFKISRYVLFAFFCFMLLSVTGMVIFKKHRKYAK